MNQFELIASLTHELRNPICTVNNLLYLLRREITDSSQVEMLNGIEAANDEIQDLINNLAEFSKLQSGPVMPCLEKFSLHQIITQLNSRYAAHSHSKNIVLSFADSKDQAIELYGNKTQIHQLIHHVLGLMISISHASQISIDSDIADASPSQTLHFKIRFQGSVQENQRLNHYFSGQIHEPSLYAIPKSNTDLHVALCKTCIQSLKAEIFVRILDTQCMHLAVNIPLNLPDDQIIPY